MYMLLFIFFCVIVPTAIMCAIGVYHRSDEYV